MTGLQSVPESTHFTLHELAKGVFAAIHRSGGGAICNAGIVDLGDRTLVFDTFLAPQPARDLRQAAEMLTGRKVATVINSHCHSDHIWGNQVFPEADLVSTHVTRRLIVETRGDTDYDDTLATAPARLQTMLALLAAATDERQRRELALWVDEFRSIAAAAPVLQVRLPDISFSQRLTYHGTERSAELYEYAGHTVSDVVMFLPEERVAFMGDLLFVGVHPYLGDGDPVALLSALQAVAGRNPLLLVPGHGPVAGPESLTLMQQYVQDLQTLVERLVDGGTPEGAIGASTVPTAYDPWDVPSFFASNLRYLYGRYRRGTEVGATAVTAQ